MSETAKESEELTKEDVLAWLKAIGRDRTWFADMVGRDIGTVNNWLSTTGIPRNANAVIRRLMQPTQADQSAGLEVTFTAGKFERIEAARSLSGHPTRAAFYEDAISSFVEQILAEEAQRENVIEPPKGAFGHTGNGAPPTQKVAEDGTNYGSSRRRPKT